MNVYYYIENNQQQGPVSLNELKARINPDTMIWTEGMANWAPARTVPEVMQALTPPTPQPQYQQPPYQQQPYQQPQYQPPYQQPQYRQPQYQPPYGEQRPDNYLVWSILSLVLCCWPAGIVAVIFSSQVNSKWERGDYEGARRAANNAKTWTIVSAVLGVVMGIIYSILIASGELTF